MRILHRLSIVILLLVVLLAGCATPRQRSTLAQNPTAQQPEAPRTFTGPKKITAAILDAPREVDLEGLERRVVVGWAHPREGGEVR